MFATDREYRDFQRRVDWLCSMILSSDYPEEEVERQRLHLREKAFATIPDRIDLYDMVYESRFTRLWEQFRELYEEH